MKIKSKLFILLLLISVKIKAQTCVLDFTYTAGPNGSLVFSNTSVPANPSAPATYIWDMGNGTTFTTNLLSQTVAITYTSNGAYTVLLSEQSCTSTVQTVNYSNPACPLSASMSAVNAAFYTPTVNFTSLSTGTTLSTTYNWEFGDGMISSSTNPTHIYMANGAFSYTLRASNNATCNSFQVASIVGLPPPTWALICSYTPVVTYTPNGSGSVTFSVSQTTYPWYFVWEYGDDLYSPTPNMVPTITYTYFDGTYNASVIVFSNLLSCGPFTLNTVVTVTGNPCDANAAFTYTPSGASTILFSKTTPATNTNISHSWYFGDGVSSNQLNPSHTYSVAGYYRAYHISYDNLWPISSPADTNAAPCHTFNAVNFSITGVPCVANSGFTIYPSGAPQSYYINMFYPYNVTSALWDWGDGTTSNVLYPMHTYSVAGNYSVCLTVTTSCGAISTSCVSQYFSKGAEGDMLYVSVLPNEISNGIEERMNGQLNFGLFPNPSNGELNLVLNEQWKPEEIKVYDMFGKEVYSDGPVTEEQSLKLNLSKLENGIYFLQVRSSNRSGSSKFIIFR